MKKLFTTALVLTLATTLNVCAMDIQKEEKGTISVSAQANKEFAPNVAKISFYVDTENKDLQEATKLNKEQAKKALDAVKALLDEKDGDTIKTTNFNAAPQYKYSNNTKIFINYKVTNGFEVTLKNVDVLGKVISAGLTNGATRVGDLNFSLHNTQNACDNLIKDAVTMAKSRAQVVAGAAGGTISGIKSINANCSAENSYHPRFAMNSAKMMSDSISAEESAMPTELGTIKLYASANAIYYVK